MGDIFTKSFLEGFASTNISAKYVLMALLNAFLMSSYVFFVHRFVTRKAFYSKNFGISLVGVALITSAIIITIQTSVVVSLGMVGALSIVRFRTAIKDPLDLTFLFWSISIGIICGAGFAEYAVILCLAMTAAYFVLDRLPVAKAPKILIVNSESLDNEKEIMDVIKKYARYSNVKSRNISGKQMDLSIELRTDNDADIAKDIAKIYDVSSVSIIKHDGEVTF